MRYILKSNPNARPVEATQWLPKDATKKNPGVMTVPNEYLPGGAFGFVDGHHRHDVGPGYWVIELPHQRDRIALSNEEFVECYRPYLDSPQSFTAPVEFLRTGPFAHLVVDVPAGTEVTIDMSWKLPTQ